MIRSSRSEGGFYAGETIVNRQDGEVLQRWENSERASSSEEKKDKNTSPKDPDLGVSTTMTGQSSLGGQPFPREELRIESIVSRQSRTSNTNKEERAREGSRVEILTWHLEISIFKGWNPEGWIFHVERFFLTHGMTEEKKIAAAIINLDSEALVRFQWEEGHHPIQN